MSNIQNKIKSELGEKLQKELGIKNPMAVPKLSKIVVNIGVKDAVSDKKNIQIAASVMTKITGQKPKIVKAKKSIAAFKLREGDQIGVVTTLRGKRMYDFFEKLVGIVMPRMRDFHGIGRNHFDKRGNYTLGFSEYTVFPEVDEGKVEKVQGIEATIVTTAQKTSEAEKLLEELGMPFEKVEK